MSTKRKPTVFPDCPHWGKGGRYVIDITNGQRVRVDDKKVPAAASTDATGAADAGNPADQTKTAKEVKRA